MNIVGSIMHLSFNTSYVDVSYITTGNINRYRYR